MTRDVRAFEVPVATLEYVVGRMTGELSYVVDP